jgi:S-formylglutathione hydrolase FrmB
MISLAPSREASRWIVRALFILLLPFGAVAADSSASAAPRFEISLRSELKVEPKPGRLFVVLSRTNNPEPRFDLGKTDSDAPLALARDVKGIAAGSTEVLDSRSFIFPATNLAELPAGDYFVQAVFDSNPDLRLANAPGNLFSAVQRIALPATDTTAIKLELSNQVPPEHLPPDTESLKYIKLQSRLLSDFFGRPIYLRAGVLLPREYGKDPSRNYPLWVRIGGFNTRYTSIGRTLSPGAEFRKVWLDEKTPQVLVLQVDGAGPYGDCYQINSANNGPYGDALVQELIPFVEKKFLPPDRPRTRVVSGVSTGGWVCLALQIFYPDFFDGAWSSCPDPVDFRSFEIVNIYEDANAFVDKNGQEIPSERNLKGKVTLTMRQEVGAENLLGRGNSYCLSGGQWGAWAATFGPRGADGSPVPIWDPQSGKIDHEVAAHWKKYDLRLILEQNWKELAPKLRGKIHIASGEADQYYLNKAVHLLQDSLANKNPPFEGSIVFGPGKGHGWSNLSNLEMLKEISRVAEQPIRATPNP